MGYGIVVRLLLGLAAGFLAQPSLARAGTMAEAQRPPAPDYADVAAWACRPGREGHCTAKLDAVLLAADGRQSPQPFRAAAHPRIDCFYVYPTAAREPQDYADATPSPAVLAAIHAEAGRLAAQCRLFVPLYRQATLFHLHHPLRDRWDGPDQDILAAWDWYLAHDNDGRGVVLIGHSQGARLLQHLMAKRIDGQPAQARLVSAFLIGDPSLRVAPGETSGGSFRHIPLCGATAQTGCVYAWSSYQAGDKAPRAFGRNRDGLLAACTNPAQPGDAGLLDAYFSAAGFPAAKGAAFVAVPGQIAAACESDAQGNVLRVTVPPGPYAAAITARLNQDRIRGTPSDWGLHRDDLALAQGSVLAVIAAEAAHWPQAPR